MPACSAPRTVAKQGCVRRGYRRSKPLENSSLSHDKHCCSLLERERDRERDRERERERDRERQREMEKDKMWHLGTQKLQR